MRAWSFNEPLRTPSGFSRRPERDTNVRRLGDPTGVTGDPGGADSGFRSSPVNGLVTGDGLGLVSTTTCSSTGKTGEEEGLPSLGSGPSPPMRTWRPREGRCRCCASTPSSDFRSVDRPVESPAPPIAAAINAGSSATTMPGDDGDGRFMRLSLAADGDSAAGGAATAVAAVGCSESVAASVDRPVPLPSGCDDLAVDPVSHAADRSAEESPAGSIWFGSCSCGHVPKKTHHRPGSLPRDTCVMGPWDSTTVHKTKPSSR